MRVLLLLLLLSTSTVFAQFPNLVEVDEYTAENPKRMVELFLTTAFLKSYSKFYLY